MSGLPERTVSRETLRAHPLRWRALPEEPRSGLWRPHLKEATAHLGIATMRKYPIHLTRSPTTYLVRRSRGLVHKSHRGFRPVEVNLHLTAKTRPVSRETIRCSSPTVGKWPIGFTEPITMTRSVSVLLRPVSRRTRLERPSATESKLVPQVLIRRSVPARPPSARRENVRSTIHSLDSRRTP
jgi:hypothetical protein